MNHYTYTAYKESGEIVKGQVEAPSKEGAMELIASWGYIPDTLKEDPSTPQARAKTKGFSFLPAPVKHRDMILFTKQFKTLIQAGIPMLQALTVMETQTENKKLKAIAATMAEDIRGGRPLTTAFNRHPRVFSPLYCAMVRAGEAAGALPEVLDRLIAIIDHEHKVKSEIKDALRYPIIVTLFLLAAFIVLLTFVIPKFVAIFQQAKIDLPLPTRICMSLHEFFQAQWPFLVGGSLLGLILILRFFKTQKGRLVRDGIALKIPLTGPLVLKAAMSRFASIFAILQSSGITVLDSLDILSGTLNNAAITREFSKIKEHLSQGKGISTPLARAKYFPPMVINMIAVGEESGNMDDMLRDIANHYDTEVEYATKGLSDAMGPLLTLGLAAVMVFFALAIFLPMWDLTQMVR